ncbi:hypothetical protein HHI36_003868 [Cryptolaemus montrouzieri]|uniref:Major facilitator superfamily (MFS) profile domain-containing protein n=1 Tax=Cryptolaemus montrouzieri TaxID=559131 RepID=A0ABD2NQA6_9CUCU
MTNGQMHRPHSVAHLSLPKSSSHKYEQNGNIPISNKMRNKHGSRMAFSQPMLAMGSRNPYGSQHLRKHGPLDKPDVFYQGSLLNIPSYKSKLDLKHRTGEETSFLERKSSISYRKRKHEDDDEEVQPTLCGIACSAETRETMKEMMDFSLFRDVIFILFTISNFLTSIGFNIPYVYLVPRAKSLGLTARDGAILIAVVGIANTIGRIVLGYLSDKAWVNRLHVYNWSLTVCGISTMLSAFCTDFTSLCIYASVFGCTIGVYVGLTSVILVDLLGLDRLTNAFGLLLLFQGIASLVGPPIGGALYDLWLSYDYAFYLSGATVAMSGLMLFIIPPVQRCLEKKNRKSGTLPTEI